MANQKIGIIGGSGLYEIEGIRHVDRIHIETPFGNPSDAFEIGELEGREIVFLPRHGRGHRISPTEVNYRANIWGMKKLGVEWILSVSAVGSLKKEIKPCDFVLIDQFIDRSNQGRKTTFFDDGIVAHISFSHPICEELSRVVYEAGQECGEGANIHWGGTYLNMEGPAFSTRAESLLYKSWGANVIGMTNMPEARLAREAEMCYATIAMATDYDSWVEGELDEMVNVEMILANLQKNVVRVKKILRQAILNIPLEHDCTCNHALENAIVTSPDVIPEGAKKRLNMIIGKYIQ
ncbi:S-methyl-5'-thioadenosine phosphorylase [candidate division KSB1 bacterium]|nr:S-methyl-5'-thioadenosine phosphorylase [candidate division KSB1 bacterium]